MVLDEREFINILLRHRVKRRIFPKPNKPSMTTSFLCTRSIATVIAALSFSGLVASSSFAQTTATTIPVGFITKTVPAAPAAGNPASVVISVPLYATAVFTSAVASVDSATTFTMSSATWTAGQFADPLAPYLVRIKTGANTGLFFAVSANTTNQLTVLLPPAVGSLVGTLNIGDSCEILPANTLASVFGTPPTLTGGASLVAADNVYLFNGTSWVAYYYSTAGFWKQSGNANRNNVVIYPDDLVFISRKDTTGPAAITLMGTVPSTSEKSEIATGSTAFANRFPVDLTLGGLGLQSIPGWVAGTTASNSDNVYLFNGTAWVKYYYSTAGFWKQSGNTNQDATPIPAGSGVFVVRAGSLALLTQALPYTP